MRLLNRTQTIEAALQLGLDLSEDAWRRLDIHVQLLEKWQSAINLVGRSTLADVWRRHVLDSLQVIPFIPPQAKIVVDLGSGAGFPGLVIAAVRQNLDVRLIEADGRKAAFLGEVARAAAPNATILNARIEAVQAFPAEVVTARALAPLSLLLEWSRKFATDPAICLFHKGENLERELTDAQADWMMDVDRVPSITAPGAAIVRVARLRSRR